jgi:HPt (histidine-containing phosphotransfer) domain-containing protein
MSEQTVWLRLAAADGGAAFGAASPPVLDAAYLARQCQGDGALEHELLALFAGQARGLCRALQSGLDGAGTTAANIAHRLKGAAAAVGALRVATSAARFEEVIGATPAATREAVLAAAAAVASEVEAACAAIERRLAAVDA